MRRIQTGAKGLTLMEVLVVVLVFLPAILTTVLVFMRCLTLIELAQNKSDAVHEAEDRLKVIEATQFDQIVGTYHQQSFNTPSLNGIGKTYVETVQPDLLRVTVSVNWREKNGRIVGEDKDTDGNMDAGEDVNANGMLDSPVQLVTMIYDL